MRIVNLKMVGCLHRTKKCERARQVRIESFELYDTLEKYDYSFGILLFLWNTLIPLEYFYSSISELDFIVPVVA